MVRNPVEVKKLARQKKEDPPKGLAPWMATFSDLMNLLLCFFVLLFSMSEVDATKFEEIAASLSQSFNSSVLSGGSSVIGEGGLISSGVSQLMVLADKINETTYDEPEDDTSSADAMEQLEQEKLALSESMANDIEAQLEQQGIGGQVDVTFTSEYVLLTLNGALLFDSGKAEIKDDALALVDKVGTILTQYESNIIEIEGHTDSRPISGGKYQNNRELSTFRALSVAEYLIDQKGIDPAKLKYSGRGEYVPVASNDTEEGRALNRRVEIRVYNNFSES
jgi:chemotaxis protein MotB